MLYTWYHHLCSANFRTNKQIPAAHQADKICPKRLKFGLPKIKKELKLFLKLLVPRRNDDEEITINYLVIRIENNLVESEHSAYSYQHMKTKLQEHFGKQKSR